MNQKSSKEFPGKGWKYFLWGVGLIFLLYMSFGFLGVPLAIRYLLIPQAEHYLQRKAVVDRIEFDPIFFSLSAGPFKLFEPGASEIFFSFEKMLIDLDFSSLYKRAAIIREFKLEQPFVNLIHERNQQFNFSDLIRNPSAASPEGSSSGFFFEFNKIQISDGEARLEDQSKSKIHALNKLNLSINSISNFERENKNPAILSLSVQINQSPFSMKGKIKPFSPSKEADLAISFQNMDIPYYMSYLPINLLLEVASGTISGDTILNYSQMENGKQNLRLEGKVGVKQLKIVNRKGEMMLLFPELSFNISPSQLLIPQIHFSRILLHSPQFNLARDPSGNFNYLSLFPSSNTEAAANGQKKQEKTAFSLLLDQLEIKSGIVSFYDHSTSKPFQSEISHIDLSAENLSFPPREKVRLTLSAQTFDSGKIALEGTVGLSPLLADLHLNLNKISLAEAQPYVPEKIKLFLASGQISSSGDIQVAMMNDQPQMTFQGNLSVDQFATLDQLSKSEFVKWNQLTFTKVNMGYNPLFVMLDEIRLSDFYFPFIVNADGSFNVSDIFGGTSTDTEKDKESSAPGESPLRQSFKLNIQKVSLEKGHLRFMDKKIQPNYFLNLNELESRLHGLTEIYEKPANISLKGKLNGQTPLQINGKIHPLAEKFFLDLELQSKGIDMSSFSTYSSRFLGYKIEKGQLSLNLKYKVSGNHIDSENSVLLDHFTLGQEVESPDALNVPLKLALAILEDRNGKIQLDIPVKGRLDDPEISFGATILQALVNLLEKVVTAPFSHLGSLFGDEEDLQYIEFDHGQAVLTKDALKKLSVIGNVLRDRPQLKLELEGSFDQKKDAETLRQKILEKRLKIEKFSALQKNGISGINLNGLTLSPQEKEFYLKALYLSENQSFPETQQSSQKELTSEQMKNWLLKRIEVNSDNLRELAVQRALIVRSHLIETKNLPGERIFITESEKMKQAKSLFNRVELRIK
ncbi:MAG: DUF748 domain-containing protein [SAR324 cluster bacterium]|nr:DUF748 domain-containing protein [SAR324 cluster bacterium]